MITFSISALTEEIKNKIEFSIDKDVKYQNILVED